MEEKPADPKSRWYTPPFYFCKTEDAGKIRDAIADGCCTAWRRPAAAVTYDFTPKIGIREGLRAFVERYKSYYK